MPLPPELISDNSLSLVEASTILDDTLISKRRNDVRVLAFIDSYLNCRNVSEAARAAGVERHIAETWRRSPDVFKAIQKLTDLSVMKHGFDSSDIIQKVKDISEVDPIDLQNADGTYKKRMDEIPPALRRSLKKLEIKNIYSTDPNGMKFFVGEIIKYEFYDKMKAIELLGREVELFKTTTKVEHDITSNMSAVLLESAGRADARAIEMRDVGNDDITLNPGRGDAED